MKLDKEIIWIWFGSVIVLSVSGCTNVEPWERENLAQSHMKIIPNPLLNAFTEHVNFSREGTEGGFGIQGGGCGCN